VTDDRRARRAARTLARVAVAVRADGPLLAAAAAGVRRRPDARLPRSLGWHLGQAASGRPRTARLTDGGRLRVDVRDHAHRRVYLAGEYEPGLTAVVRELARPGWTVLDVGANVGYFSLVATAAGGPASEALAFEPNPPVAELLRGTVARNPGRRISVVEAACAEREGRAALQVAGDPGNSGLSTLAGPLEGGRTVEVRTLRLDRFCAEHGIEPDLLKIDVEGAEALVLRGAEDLLRRGRPPDVLCEVWDDGRDEVLALMAGHGYAARPIAEQGSAAGGWENLHFEHRPA